MSYIRSTRICTKCKETNKLFRFRWHGQNGKYLLVSHCKECELKTTREHQKANREYWRKLNNKSYLNWSSEQKERRRLKAHNRTKRLHPVNWDKELTEFVTEEAHILRQLRNKYTQITWHVDHIIPLNGKLVSGLHVWNNLQVIPATENYAKKNNYVVGG